MALAILICPGSLVSTPDTQKENIKYFKNLEPIKKTNNLFLKNSIIYDKVPLVDIKNKTKI